MSNEQLEQVEALEAASPYCEKMIKAISRIIKEYSGEKLPDTDDYMHSILKGMHWIFSVYDGTKSLINASGVVIDENEVNKSVIRLNDANKAEDDSERVEAFKGLLKFVETFKTEADGIIAKAA
ncbi:MAG: hypothetical protein ACI4D4_00475 [Lachnospira sp.]